MLMVFQIFPDLILMILLSVLLVQKPTFVRIVRQNEVVQNGHLSIPMTIHRFWFLWKSIL